MDPFIFWVIVWGISLAVLVVGFNAWSRGVSPLTGRLLNRRKALITFWSLVGLTALNIGGAWGYSTVEAYAQPSIFPLGLMLDPSYFIGGVCLWLASAVRVALWRRDKNRTDSVQASTRGSKTLISLWGKTVAVPVLILTAVAWAAPVVWWDALGRPLTYKPGLPV